MLGHGKSWSYSHWVKTPSTRDTNTVRTSFTKAGDFFLTSMGGLNTGPTENSGFLTHTYYISSSATNLQSNDLSVSLSTWYHVVTTCDGTTTRMYFNGNLCASGPAHTSGYSSYKFDDGVGRYSSAYSAGEVDQIRLLNKAISGDEALFLYNNAA